MAHPQSKENTNQEFTELPVGEILRRTRMHYGQSPDEVERHIRVRSHMIVAIEENDVETLPARVYTIGFVRSYAEYLGLDGEKMVALYKSQAGEQHGKSPEVFVPTDVEEHYTPPIWMIILTICVILLVTGVWASQWDKERREIEEIPPVSEDIQKSASAVEESSESVPTEAVELATGRVETKEKSAEEESKPAVQIEEKQGIILNIRENSWVEVRQKGGKRLISRVLKKGDQYFVPDRPDLKMSIGNAAGVELEVDGVILKPLGSPAQVRRNIPLDAEILKRDYAP